MGMPLVMLEMGYGQFSSLSPIAVWKMAPLFEGMQQFILQMYIAVIITSTTFCEVVWLSVCSAGEQNNF